MEKKPTHKVVAVDIDGVIIDSMQGEFRPEQYDPTDTARFPTMKGCSRVLTRLWNAGYEIVLYSSRTNTDWEHNRINGYTPEAIKIALELDMKFRGLLFHYVSIYKPIADIYIDDRGWHFRDWAQMEKDLEMLGYFDEENTTH